MKFYFRLLICIAAAILLSVSVSAEFKDVLIDNCDTDGWSGSHEAVIDTSDCKEGSGCVSWTVKKGQNNFAMSKVIAPVNAAGGNLLVLDLYVSSVDLLSTTTSSDLEITSSGKYDVQENCWHPLEYDLTDGWNHLELPMEKISGGCNFAHINFIRFFAIGLDLSDDLTVKIDNVYVSYVTPEGGEPKKMSDFEIGKDDSASAKPVYTPVKNTGTDPAKPSGGSKEDMTLPIILFILAAVFVVLGIVFRSNRLKMTVAVIGGAVLAICGVLMMFYGGDIFGDDKQPAVSPTNEIIKTLTDQTGHPEVSAENADVEALLRVDPAYSTKEDYMIRFNTAAASDAAIASNPSVVFDEKPVENGIHFENATDFDIVFKNVKNKNCYEFTRYRDHDANSFRLTVTDEKRAGKIMTVHFLVWADDKAYMEAEYVTAVGTKKTVKGSSVTRFGEWVEYQIKVSASTPKGLDGADYRFTCLGAETVRIAAAWVTESVSADDSDRSLISSDKNPDSYIVADVNVQSFGAIGDGRTDDTEAFRNAIAAAAGLGGGTVFVPEGFYCITSSLTLPHGVSLTGLLERGTVNGTVLCIYSGKGKTDKNQGAIIMDTQSAVQNIAFWYPEQTFVNGKPIPYPATIVQSGMEGVTVRNVTFVNSYFAIDYAMNDNNSLQYTRDITGTPLSVGYENDASLDIGKLENVDFSAECWLKSGLPGTPNEELLRTWLIRNATGVILERIDWTYISDIRVEGYHIGINCRKTSAGCTNGQMFNMTLENCYYCVKADYLEWMMITGCRMTAVGGEGAAAIYSSSKNKGNFAFNDCVLKSSGYNAVINYGSSEMTFCGCELESAKPSVIATAAKYALSDCSISSDEYKTVSTDINKIEYPDYARDFVAKPKSDAIVFADLSSGDAGEALQSAIDSLKETGGTVYIKPGTYVLNRHIDVWEGIEIRGHVSWASNMNTTAFSTEFGLNDPDGEALFTLYSGAGVRGISVIYSKQNNTASLKKYSYTFRGNGKGIYIIDVCLPTSWNCVDFATNRCDDHYVEFLWAAPLNRGIEVGAGSENGIIRDCHFTPNVWCLRSDGNWWGNVYNVIMSRSKTYVIGESTNEILYHNFTYGGYEGLTALDGAKNAFVLSHGVDSGSNSMKFYGNCDVTLVDTQLVNLGSIDLVLINTDSSFCGNVDIRNVAGWGAPRKTVSLNGNGTMNIQSALFVVPGSPMCYLNGGKLTMSGANNYGRTKDFTVTKNASSLTISGNIFHSGLKIDNNSGIPVSGTDKK